MSVLQIKFSGTFRPDLFIQASRIKVKNDLILLYDKREFVAVFNRNDIMYIRNRGGVTKCPSS